MSKTWFISDTHIGHENIVHNLGPGRPFYNLAHMHQTIRNNWYQAVSPEDTIYHLGDAAMGDFSQNIGFFEPLPGNKLFVPGNHDKIFGENTKTRIERFIPDYENVGFTILPGTSFITVPVSWGEQQVLISHFPYSEDYIVGRRDKFVKSRPVDEGFPLIHGHTHSRERFSNNPLEFHVGVDANNFNPVNLDEVIVWLENLREQHKI